MVTNVVISKRYLLGRTVFEKYENMGYKWDSDPRILNFVEKIHALSLFTNDANM